MIIQDLIKKWEINNSWTLFLDRDGVINHETVGNYITSVKDFKFIEKSEDSIAYLTSFFNKTIIVTNQQGIGKKLMSEADLKAIHSHMTNCIENKGGKIDAIYHSPFLTAEKNPIQKPGVGMGLKAKEKFPEIDFKKSIMIGNSERDLIFGRSLNMKTIFIGESNNNHNYDLCIKRLNDFIK